MAYDKKNREYSPRENDAILDERFNIGIAGDRTWWTNVAILHENGRLSDQR